MKQLLFLDDEKYRHDHAYPDGDFEITHAWDLSQFINAIHHFGPFDVMSLDHDLGESHYAGKHGGCGCDAAKIVTLLEKKPQRVRIHSMNSVAGNAMWKILTDAGIEAIVSPFGTSKEGLAFLVGKG